MLSGIDFQRAMSEFVTKCNLLEFPRVLHVVLPLACPDSPAFAIYTQSYTRRTKERGMECGRKATDPTPFTGLLA
jgi:hypothetical protein